MAPPAATDEIIAGVMVIERLWKVCCPGRRIRRAASP